MDDPRATLAAWLDHRRRLLIPLTFEQALIDLAGEQRRRRGRRHRPLGTAAFFSKLARMKNDEELRRHVQESGKVLDAMRVWLLLEEFSNFARRAKLDDPEFARLNNRLYLNPSTLHACRLALDLFDD